MKQDELLGQLKRAVRGLHDTRRRLRELEESRSEPVAVVGMGCRFPGGIDNPDKLWELLAAGEDAIGPFPTDRGWDLAALFDPDPDAIGKTYTRGAGFLDDIAGFDAAFFGINPREAVAMDPQQRLLLETAWSSIEHAGIAPTSLSGSRTGVFAGMNMQDYSALIGARSSADEGYLATSSAGSVLSGRIAYTLGLEGPAVTVDAACSSSLVAVHLAVQSLRAGESDLALAGGATVMATPMGFVAFSRQRGLSVDGRCKAFADAADGTGWGEGVGVLVLERLSDAVARGHRVWAVIRGSAVNQDGASSGMSAPNGPSQQRVIGQALANAGLSAADVDAVEAHGTGTPLGDPIEAQALLATYGRDRDHGRPLWLGSVKSNIGHTQAAAGVAGVIKMVLAMQHETLPATLHVDTPSSHVDWDAGAVRLLTEARAWPRHGRPRRSGVSAFGVSGTNAHVLLEEAPVPEPVDAERSSGPGAGVWLVSARSRSGLVGQAGRLADWVRAHPELDPVDVGFALAVSRSHLSTRAGVLGADRDELLTGLDQLVAGDPGAGVFTGPMSGGRLVWVFPGQGGQWAGMAADLLDDSAVFAASIAECEAALAPYVDWSLTAVLRSDDSRADLDRVDVVQPALFAVMVSLAALWRSCGVTPDAVVGHSQGEIAAAVVAGALSLGDGARVVALRSAALRAISGAMLSVTAGAAAVRPLLARWGANLAIAAVNAPDAVVVSGTETAVSELTEALEAEGIRARRISVGYAAHSATVEPLREQLLADLADITPRPATVPFYSTVTGDVLDTATMDAEYWYRNLRETVRFETSVRVLRKAGHRIFVEVSPHPVLTPNIEGTTETADARSVALGTLRRGEGGLAQFVSALAQAHVAGVTVDWDAVFAGRGATRVGLPTYAFDHERFWPSLGPAGLGELTSMGLGSAEHPLLGAAVSLADGEGMVLTGRLSLGAYPWLADHAVFGRALFPGAGLVELALHAGHRVGAPRVAELTLEAPLIVPEHGEVRLQIRVAGPDTRTGHRDLGIYSSPGTGSEEPIWTRHAGAVLTQDEADTETDALPWPPVGAEEVRLDGAYAALAERGFAYGPMFQGLAAVWRTEHAVYGEVALPAGADAAGFGVHPALLDAALQSMLVAGGADGAGMMLPFAWQGISLRAVGATRLRVRLTPTGSGGVALLLTDDRGGFVGSVDDLVAREVTPAQLAAAMSDPATTGDLLEVEWSATAAPDVPVDATWAVLGPQRPVGWATARCYADLAALLTVLDAGEPPSVVLAPVAVGEGSLPVSAQHTAVAMLELLQAWLAEPRLASTRLVVCTRGAVAVTPDESPELGCAPVWGLVRSAQTENPGRFTLLDADPDAEADATGPLAAAIASEYAQVAVRVGAVLVPALVPAPDADAARAVPWRSGGTVLITGGTGTLGVELARHLAATRDVGCVLLASRRGQQAPAVAELAAELGVRVEVVCCDVADRASVEAMLASVPAEHPLTAVIHAAGTLDDGVIEALDAARLESVSAPKVAGAWHLHELTADLDLAAFVLFSSASGILGGPGQGNYAAANTFLDALAAHRQACGLPAVALAWGQWERSSALTATLSEADRARLRRSGLGALSAEAGLALFDSACALGRALVVPIQLDKSSAVAPATPADVPVMLRKLAPVPVRRTVAAAPTDGAGEDLRARLARLVQADQERVLGGLVRGEVAAVLGHADAALVDPDQVFVDLGFDSLTAVELRNRLATLTGLRLPPTLVFDHPTAAALARHLRDVLLEQAAARPVTTRVSAAADEPIAIVGMACRLPGGVESPEQLWDLVAAGAEGITEFPTDRGWNLDDLFDPDPDAVGKSYARHGGFLCDAAGFDAAFFGISPREALATDPQQRVLLESSWTALEHAGIDPRSLAGSRAGVFAGVIYHDYVMSIAHMLDGLEGFIGSGTAGSVVSGRVAYQLGLQGPAVTIDTACSSSLVAMHLAAQSLRTGECDLALAAGVTVMATPAGFVAFSRQRGLAPDGRCKSYADGADGTVWGEGVGTLVLERLSDAVAKGRRIWAVLRGSAVNSDGASNGLSAPSGPAQQRVIGQALADAGLSAADVDAVEGHGTGTSLGDPIEAQALLATYGQAQRAEPLWLGSVKSNIGHTQAAAGVAGVIKMVQAMQHETLPASLHAEVPSAQVDWDAGAVRLLSQARAWPSTGRPRRAGVSSFGVSGTNAHVILEQPPTAPVDDTDAVVDGPAVWLVCAGTPAAVGPQAARLATWVRERPALAAPDVALSLGTSRSPLPHRTAVVGTCRDELLAGLDRLAAGESGPHTVTGSIGPTAAGGCAVLFPGQGSQWAGMGTELARMFPVFAAALDEVCAEFDGLLDRPLREVLSATAGSAVAALLDETAYTQPALFAVEAALFRLLSNWGVRPDVVGGHSIGEVTAAHVAGVFSLPDACRLVAARARLMQSVTAEGAMVALQVGEQELGELPAGVDVAAVNGRSSVVVTGDAAAVTAVGEQWAARGRRTKRLRVSHAFHSHHMDPVLDEFAAVLATVQFAVPRIPVLSNVTGDLADPLRIATPDYWVTQARSTVRFADDLDRLRADGIGRFLEVGPGGALTSMVDDHLGWDHGSDGAGRLSVPALRPGRSETESVHTLLARLAVAGARLDWSAVQPGARRVELPTYAFDRRRFWPTPTPPVAGNAAALGQSTVDHPLLGAAIELADGRTVLTGLLSASNCPWVSDHAVFGQVLLPGTAFVELALYAGRRTHCPQLDELILQQPLVLPEDGDVALQLRVDEPGDDGDRRLTVHSRAGAAQEWVQHASAVLTARAVSAVRAEPAWPPASAVAVPIDGAYDELAEQGFSYGPAFQGVAAVWRADEVVYAEVALPAGVDAAGYGIHPALFDAAVHAPLLAAGGDGVARLPFSWRDVTLAATDATCLRVRLTPTEAGGTAVLVTDQNGRLVLSAGAVEGREITPAQLAAPRPTGGSLLEVCWTPMPDTSAAPALTWFGLGATCPPQWPAEGPVRDPHDAQDTDAVVVAWLGEPADTEQVPAAVRRTTAHVLALLKDWLAQPRGARLVLCTRGAVAVRAGETPDVRWAPVWGLVRSAQNEHPGRFTLVDVDSPDVDPLVAALGRDEPQLALRDGVVHTPALTPAQVRPADADWTPGGTVLITGGTGALGAAVARHVATGRVGGVVLASRRGPAAPGAEGLVAELTAAGVHVEVVACDVADRAAVAALLANIPADRPLTAVVHAAGGVDDGTVEALTTDRLHTVLAPKADGAWHLHELTADLDLAAFVLFSSASGILGGPGQGNYAAANTFLDALAAHRQASGRRAVSLAWGQWEQPSELLATLGETDLARMRRGGFGALATEDALALFDTACGAGHSHYVPVRLDRAALRATAPEALPAMLRGLVPAATRTVDGSGALQSRLAALAVPEQERLLEGVVLTEVATVLGHSDGGALSRDAAFAELGFDSLTAIELRNALNVRTGLRLVASVVFDHATAAELARHLCAEIAAGGHNPDADTAAVNSYGPLESLFRTAVSLGKATEGNDIIEAAARGRAMFDDGAAPARRARRLVLRTGAAGTSLIGFPSVTATSGVGEYTRIAGELGGGLSLTVQPHSGFVEGEQLPADLTNLVDTHIAALLADPPDHAPVLMGVSSGGLVAQAVAERLEALGRPVGGLVLLDSYRKDSSVPDAPDVIATIAKQMLSLPPELAIINDNGLTAMAWYFTLFDNWQPRAVTAPTLFVTPEVPLLPDLDRLLGGVRWPCPHVAVQVPGDHFSMLAADVVGTVNAVRAWLDEPHRRPIQRTQLCDSVSSEIGRPHHATKGETTT